MQGKTSVFDEVPNNYKTLIGKKYPKTVLTKVWDAVSHFIRSNLQQGKGVTIKNLGTFTFSEWKTFVGSRIVEYKEPIFVMSEKLVQFYHLKTRVPYTTGKTPIVSLNHTTVATNLDMCRQAIEDCVTEITEAFVRLISQDREVEIPFSKIGQLHIKNKQIYMNFFPKFLKDVEACCTEPDDSDEKCLCQPETERNFEDDLKSEGPKHTSSPVPYEENLENGPTDLIPCEKETI